MKNTLSLATIALLFLGLGRAALAQNFFLNGGFEPSAGNVFLLTNATTAIRNLLSVDGVSSGALANDTYVRAAYSAYPASESLHVNYLDSNPYASPGLNGVYEDLATTRGQSCRVIFHAATEDMYSLPGAWGAAAGNAAVHSLLPNLNAFALSVSPQDDLGAWFTCSLRFTAN